MVVASVTRHLEPIPTRRTSTGSASSRGGLGPKTPYFRIFHPKIREPLFSVNHYGCEPITSFSFQSTGYGAGNTIPRFDSPITKDSGPIARRDWDVSPFCRSAPSDDGSPRRPKKSGVGGLSPGFRDGSTRTSSISVSERVSTDLTPKSPGGTARIAQSPEEHECSVFEIRVNLETGNHGRVAAEVKKEWDQLILGAETGMLMDHYRRLLEKGDPGELARLYNAFNRIGCDVLAEQVMQVRLTICRANAMDDEEEVLYCLACIARSLQRQDLFSQSEPYHREVFDRRHASLGVDHPDTLTAALRLASDCRRLGKMEEAGTILTDTFERSKRILGAEHRVSLEALREYTMYAIDMNCSDEYAALLTDIQERL